LDAIATVQSEWQRLNRLLEGQAQNPTLYVQRGMVALQLGDMTAAIDDFDRAEGLNPDLTPYLWQRGIAYYYAQRFADGVTQFETDLRVNQHDVEETVWRYLCQAQLYGAPAARADLRPGRSDRRPVMARVYKLFAGECDVADLLAVSAASGRHSQFYSQFYAGLYYEAAQEAAHACQHITQAVAMERWDDYMGWVARVHCRLRGWQRS
jgi:tetratricopeptide (TPR) repeat protein